MAKFFSYAWDWIVRPVQAAEDQLYEEHRTRLGFWAVLVFGVLYSVASLVLYLRGFSPVFETVLPIPESAYYLWQTFFTVPWALLTWFAAGVIIHLWNRIFTREFRRGIGDILGPLGFASVIPWFFFTWLPEMVAAPILGPWGFSLIPVWIEVLRQLIPAVWTALLIYIAVRKVYEANWFRAAGSAILGIAVLLVMFLLFLR